MTIDIEKYYRLYGPMVLRRCRFLLKDEDTALDAMQEVFVKLLKNKSKLRGDYPSSLLHRIATNVCLNLIRDQNRKFETSCEEILMNLASAENIESRVIASDLLEKIFRKEQISTREIAVMHYVDKMTLKEVADETGLSVSGVRKRLRTLRTKAKIIEENYNETNI